MEPAISVRDLTKRFPGERPQPWSPPRSESIALDRVSFDVAPGEVLSLIGPNGAGKTTLLKILTTLLRPTAGSVRVLGHDVVADEAWVRARVALVTNSERSFYYRLTGWENLRFFCGLYNLGRAELAERIHPMADDLGLTPAVLAQSYRAYSTGTQRKLQFLRAFVLDTPLLFLDEPTSSLDPVSSEEIRRIVQTECRRRRQTVVLSANNLVDVERLADRVAFIHHGRLEMIGRAADGPGPGPVRVTLRAAPERVDAALRAGRSTVGALGEWALEARAGLTVVRLVAENPEATATALLDLFGRQHLAIEQIDLRPFVLEEEFLRRVDPILGEAEEGGP